MNILDKLGSMIRIRNDYFKTSYQIKVSQSSILYLQAHQVVISHSLDLYLGIRRLSARLLCELTFNNENMQGLVSEMLGGFSLSGGATPGGKVCLNVGIPEEIR